MSYEANNSPREMNQESLRRANADAANDGSARGRLYSRLLHLQIDFQEDNDEESETILCDILDAWRAPAPPPRIKMTIGRARALRPLLHEGELQTLANQLWVDYTHRTTALAEQIAKELGVWPTGWERIRPAQSSKGWQTAKGNTILRQPTRIELELVEMVIKAFGIKDTNIDAELYALILSDVLICVCNYTPGEKTVAQAQEDAAFSGMPFFAEEGIKAFVQVLRQRRPYTSIVHFGPNVLDQLIKNALKGEINE